MNRICKDCGIEKDEINFAKAGIVNGITYYRYRCIQCYSKFKQIRKHKVKDEFLNFKKTLKCAECGNNDFRVLDFDHIDRSTKEFNVADGIQGGFSIEKLMNEVSKCQVLCANCHRMS